MTSLVFLFLFSIDNESVVALTTLLCCYNESFLVSHVMNSILNPNLPLVLNLLPNLSKLKVKLSRHKFGILQDKNVIELSPRLITGEKFWGAVLFLQLTHSIPYYSSLLYYYITTCEI